MKRLAALLVAIPLAATAQEATPPPYPAPAEATPRAPEAAPGQPPPPAQEPPPAYPPPPQAAPPAAPPPPPYTPVPPYLPQEKQRDRWYIGFGLGGGDGSLDLPAGLAGSGGSTSFGDYVGSGATTVFVNFKVGATLTPRLLLGFDLSGIRSESDAGGGTSALQISNFDAVATFFPTGRGFFVRGGLGLSAFQYEVKDPGFSVSDEVGGVNVLAGIGYAFWLGRSFNLTLNLDVSAQSYGDKNDPNGLLPDSSSFGAAWVGFDWY